MDVHSFRSSDTNEDLSATLNATEETSLEAKVTLAETTTEDLLENESHSERGEIFFFCAQ